MNPRRLKRLWHLEEMQRRLALLEAAAAEAARAEGAGALQRAQDAFRTEARRQTALRRDAATGAELLQGDACLSAQRQLRQEAERILNAAEVEWAGAQETLLQRERRQQQVRRLWERMDVKERQQTVRREGRQEHERFGTASGGPRSPTP